MSYFFSERSTYDSVARQEFNEELTKFLNISESNKRSISVSAEFKCIEEFISNQPDLFIEETLLNTVSKLLEYTTKTNQDNYLVNFSQNFVDILHNKKFAKYFDKIKKYGTKESFNPIRYFLENDKITLAWSFTNMFLLEQNRDVNGFPINYYCNNDFIEQCLTKNKIAALSFLLENYKGFNTSANQAKFLKYSDMDEIVLNNVFSEKRYVPELEESVKSFLNKGSVTFEKKMKIVEFFSEIYIPKPMVEYIFNQIEKNNITFKSLEKYKFNQQLLTPETVFNMFGNNDQLYSNIQKCLEKAEISKEKSTQLKLEIIKSKKETINTLYVVKFIIDNTEVYKENKDFFEQILLNSNSFDIKILFGLSEKILFSEEFKKSFYNKNPDSYLFFKDNYKQDDIIKEAANIFIRNTELFKEIDNLKIMNVINEEFYSKLFQELKAKLTPQEMFEKLFLHGVYSFTLSDKLNLVKEPIVFDLDLNNNNFITNISFKTSEGQLRQLVRDDVDKKWYNFFSSEPLQIVFESGKFRLIKNPEEKIVLDYSGAKELIEENKESSFDSIIEQSKKDLKSFQKLTGTNCEFNLEFKIRAESIFMQQINFLSQIKKLENELNVNDMYFLKNNLGKYLVQCTETYGRSLNRYQALVENPSLLKKSPEALEAQKEKIDLEALKQISLLEKEMEMVKNNVINTINNESFCDMRVNTKILESNMSNEISYENDKSNIVKIKQSK